MRFAVVAAGWAPGLQPPGAEHGGAEPHLSLTSRAPPLGWGSLLEGRDVLGGPHIHFGSQETEEHGANKYYYFVFSCLPPIPRGEGKGLTGEMNSPLPSFAVFMPSYLLPPLLSQQGQVKDMLISNLMLLETTNPLCRERGRQFKMEKGQCVKRERSKIISPFIFPDGRKLEQLKENSARFVGEKEIHYTWKKLFRWSWWQEEWKSGRNVPRTSRNDMNGT